MSSNRTSDDLGVEREIDLRRWLDAALAYWWIAVVGLIVGAGIGLLTAVTGKTTYMATATIVRGQAFSPSGSSVVLSYLGNLKAIQVYSTSPQTLLQISAKTGIPVTQLQGHIVASTFTSTGELSTTNTGSVIVGLAVTLSSPKKAVDAANELADIIQKVTTTPYVLQTIQTIQIKIKYYKKRIVTLQQRVNAYTDALNHKNDLSFNDKLLVSTELDTSEAALGSTLDSLFLAQEQLTLSQDVEKTQILQRAVAVKIPGRSSRNAVVFGGAIGLILGLIVALLYGVWARRKTAE